VKLCSVSKFQKNLEGESLSPCLGTSVSPTSAARSFFALHSIIHPRATTEFVYRYNHPERAHVLLSFKILSSSRPTEVSSILAQLEQEGMKGLDLSESEMAKSHARYLIGGCQSVPHERLFRFRESPPAMLAQHPLPF
jgi:threonine dehydratase